MSFPFPKRIKGGTFNQSSAVTVENKTHLFEGIQVCRKVGMTDSDRRGPDTDPKNRVKGSSINGLNQLFDRNLNTKIERSLLHQIWHQSGNHSPGTISNTLEQP